VKLAKRLPFGTRIKEWGDKHPPQLIDDVVEFLGTFKTSDVGS
jgi:hypothetical protein